MVQARAVWRSRLPDAELFELPEESHLAGLGRGEEILSTLMKLWDEQARKSNRFGTYHSEAETFRAISGLLREAEIGWPLMRRLAWPVRSRMYNWLSQLRITT